MGTKKLVEVFGEVEGVFGLRGPAKDVASHLAAFCSDGDPEGWEGDCEEAIYRLVGRRGRLWDWVATRRGEVFRFP